MVITPEELSKLLENAFNRGFELGSKRQSYMPDRIGTEVIKGGFISPAPSPYGYMSDENTVQR